MSRSRNWHDVISLGHHPGECELRGRALLLLRDLFDFLDELQILFEVVALKARVLSSEIIHGKIFRAFDLARQESTTEGAVGDEADAEHAQGIEQSIFGIARPQ